MAERAEKPKSTDTCIHGNFPPCEICQLQTKEKKENQVQISAVNPENPEEVMAYLQFEEANNYWQPREGDTIENFASYRQRLIKENKLQVITAREGEKMVGVAMVVLADGTMGRKLAEDEASAADTLVASDKRGQGILEKISEGRERIARTAGKKSMITKIDDDNWASMRSHLRLGYQVESFAGYDSDTKKPHYQYRKDLIKETGPTKDWVKEYLAGQIATAPVEINNQSPDQILVDPLNENLVDEVTKKGYRGVYLLRPDDFEDPTKLDKNYLVFIKL
jgi:hypothetical protein